MNKYIKLVAAAALIGLGIYMMFFTRELGWGIVVFLLAAFPILIFFKNENILRDTPEGLQILNKSLLQTISITG